jgi:hypothetical protein
MSNWQANFTDFTSNPQQTSATRQSSFVQALEDYETKI